MASLAQSPSDCSRRTLPAAPTPPGHPGHSHPARTASVWILSAVFVALCGGDFTPPPTTAHAAPATAVSGLALSALCARTVPLRRGDWTVSADTSAPLDLAQPDAAMPAQVCVTFDHDLPAEARWQWRTVRPSLADHASLTSGQAATTQGWTSGGSSGGTIAGGEPCTASRAIVWTIAVSQWAVPPGCFGGIFTVNPNTYGVETSDYGWCAWWPIAITHNDNALGLPRHSTPVVGAVMWFPPGNQGAGSDGHWGYVESIGPNGWLLISEMNDNWRGGGWARVNYRYVRVTSGNAFLY